MNRTVICSIVGLLTAALCGCHKDNENLPPPVISSFSPVAGLSGTTVHITGSNFGLHPADNIVEFNGLIASVSASSATSITAVVPSGASTGPISVNTNGRLSTTTSDFTVFQRDSIASFSPLKGSTGTTVTITGKNFDPVFFNNTVKFNGTMASVASATSTSILTTVPYGATTGPITVTVNGVTAVSSLNFSVTSITGISPLQAFEGDYVEIDGTNFDPSPGNNLVKFGAIIAPVLNSSETKLVVMVPTGTQSGQVSVTTGGLTAISPSNFTLKTGTNATPASGPVGTQVTVTGSGFDPIASNDIIYFAGTSVSASSASSTSLTFTVQPTTYVGNYTGNITISANSVVITSSPRFTIAPFTVMGLSPINGQVGATVTITGTGFDPNPAHNYISFSNTGKSIQPISASQTQLTFIIPDWVPTVSRIMLSTDGTTYANGPFFAHTNY